MVVAAGDQRSSRRRTEGSGVELRIAQPRLGDAVQGWCRDNAAKGATHAVALVIRHDQEHIRRTFGRNHAGWPPGRRILGAFLDHSPELGWRRRKLLTINRCGGV